MVPPSARAHTLATLEAPAGPHGTLVAAGGCARPRGSKQPVAAPREIGPRVGGWEYDEQRGWPRGRAGPQRAVTSADTDDATELVGVVHVRTIAGLSGALCSRA